MSNLNFNSHFNEGDFDFSSLFLKIKRSKEIIREGTTILNKSFLEELVDDCLENFRYKEAYVIIDSLLKVSPCDSEFWYQKGVCLSQLNHNKAAIKCFKKSLSLNPFDIEISLDLASSQLALNRFSDAADTLQSALEIEPNNHIVFYKFGKLYQQKHLYDLSIDFFRKAIEIDKNYSDAYFQLAISMEFSNKPNEALAAYDDYLMVEPMCEIGWFNRALILDNLGLKDQAIRCYEFSVAIDETFSDAYFNLANLLADKGEYEKAISCLEKVISIDKYDPTAYFNLGTLYDDENNLKKAVYYYSKALYYDSSYHEAYLSRGFAYFKLNKIKKSFKDLINAMANNNYDSKDWIFFQYKTIDEILIRRIVMLKDKEKGGEISHNELLMLNQHYITTGRYKDSIELVKKMFNPKTQGADYYFLLAKTYFCSGKPIIGMKYLKKSFKIDNKVREKFEYMFPEVFLSNLFNSLNDYILNKNK